MVSGQAVSPPLCHLWLDAGYRGEDKGKEWVEKRYARKLWIADFLRHAVYLPNE